MYVCMNEQTKRGIGLRLILDDFDDYKRHYKHASLSWLSHFLSVVKLLRMTQPGNIQVPKNGTDQPGTILSVIPSIQHTRPPNITLNVSYIRARFVQVQGKSLEA